jgi:hypothetical protein
MLTEIDEFNASLTERQLEKLKEFFGSDWDKLQALMDAQTEEQAAEAAKSLKSAALKMGAMRLMQIYNLFSPEQQVLLSAFI